MHRLLNRSEAIEIAARLNGSVASIERLPLNDLQKLLPPEYTVSRCLTRDEYRAQPLLP